MDRTTQLEQSLSEQTKRVNELIETMDEMEQIMKLTEESEDACLHDALERSLPENQKGGTHLLACPCPKCSPRC